MLELSRDSFLIHVVDDDAEFLDAIKFALGSANWRVQTYESARTFIEMADLSFPGCIVLDLNMPVMSGLQLQQWLSENKEGLQPIVFLTAYGNMNTAIHAFRHGAFDFLQKPFEPEALLEVIARAVKASEKEFLGRARESALSRWESLTEKQKLVFKDLQSGLSSAAIAEHLGISERTLQRHRQNVMRKLRIVRLADLLDFWEKLQEERRQELSHARPN